jgi:hypothetical protein
VSVVPKLAFLVLQLEQMFRAIGINLHGDISTFPRHLADFDEVMTDPDLISFQCVKH